MNIAERFVTNGSLRSAGIIDASLDTVMDNQANLWVKKEIHPGGDV